MGHIGSDQSHNGWPRRGIDAKGGTRVNLHARKPSNLTSWSQSSGWRNLLGGYAGLDEEQPGSFNAAIRLHNDRAAPSVSYRRRGEQARRLLLPLRQKSRMGEGQGFVARGKQEPRENARRGLRTHLAPFDYSFRTDTPSGIRQMGLCYVHNLICWHSQIAAAYIEKPGGFRGGSRRVTSRS